MIELVDVSLQAGSRPLLDHFSLTLPDPGMYVISGPTGSGKSLLCRLISGLLRPSSGQVRIDGSRPRHSLARAHGDFYGTAESVETYNESIRDYLVSELAVAGVTVRSAADYFGLLDAYFPAGVLTPMATLSSGERLILQAVLAACAPGRIAILDGHLNQLSEAAAAYCWQILQSSQVEHEKFFILTANRDHAYLEGEFSAIRLAGGLPVALAV